MIRNGIKQLQCCIQIDASHSTRRRYQTENKKNARSASVLVPRLFGVCSLRVFTSALLHFFKGFLFIFFMSLEGAGMPTSRFAFG